jgi:S-adenosylmethionine-diacylgycerolhomoserine-N-methlytransferase
MKVEHSLSNIQLSEKKAELGGYYRLHAPIYDLTRWAFLFGRNKLIKIVVNKISVQPKMILDVGCGTGKNIIALAKAFPDAKIIGCDLSDAMLSQARGVLRKSLTLAEHKNIELINSSILTMKDRQFDLIVCSYMLSMTADSLVPILHNIRRRLNPAGTLAIVDFEVSGFALFRRWMRVNHVALDGSVLQALSIFAKVEHQSSHQAFGLWRWFMWLGR